MTGAEAAGVFYDPARFQRAGVAPPPLRKTLFGQGGVQDLDGEHHRQRKAMFLQINQPSRVQPGAFLEPQEPGPSPHARPLQQPRSVRWPLRLSGYIIAQWR